MTAILAGEIEITYVAVLTGLQHFKAGRLSPLAVAGRSRYPALPEVPTAEEAGLKGYEIDFWYARPAALACRPAPAARTRNRFRSPSTLLPPRSAPRAARDSGCVRPRREDSACPP